MNIRINTMPQGTQPTEKSSKQNVVFFTILFTACILGSIGIFIFAVGLETGNKIVNFTMRSLIENATVVLILFAVFNAVVFWIYMVNKRKG